MLDQPPPRRIKIEPLASELDDLEMNAKVSRGARFQALCD